MVAAAVQAGQDADAYCSKCKLVLAHVVIAMRGTRPARVECKTCGAVHAYKKEAPGTRTRKTTRASTAKNSFEALVAGRDVSQARKYKMSVEFTEEEILDHKAFGIGVVTRVLSDNKINVTFQTGEKVLVHAR